MRKNFPACDKIVAGTKIKKGRVSHREIPAIHRPKSEQTLLFVLVVVLVIVFGIALTIEKVLIGYLEGAILCNF